MMDVWIILRSIQFGGPSDMPEARTAVVAFEIHSEDVGTVDLTVSVIPKEGDPNGLDGAVMIARKTLIEFGKALAAAGESYQPPMIYSPKSE